MIELRDYQVALVGGIKREIAAGRRTIVGVAPTGAGKTTIFSHITTGASAKGKNVLLLAHRQELVSQGADTLARFGLRHEVIAPTNVRAAIAVNHVRCYGRQLIDPTSNVRVASVQTLSGRLEKIRWLPDIIIVDEGHHCTEGSTWGKVLDHYRKLNPGLLVLLFTATPVRLDGKGLGAGHGGYADAMVIGPSIGELIERGFLCKPIVYAPPNALDLAGIRTRFGDYAKGELEQAVDKKTITGDAVDHYRKICPGEPAVAFCVSIAHAEHVAAEFKAAGFRAVAVNGSTPDAERRKILAGLGNGTVDVVTSADLIGEGVDIPAVRCAILLRPTMSLSLYIQQVGRCLRPAPGKPNAIILDHVGNSLIHGLIDEDRNELWTLEGLKKRGRKAANDNVAPQAVRCPKCHALHRPAPECPSCDHVYLPTTGRKLEQTDGELVQITDEMAERLRKQKKKEVGKAQSLEELERIERERKYKKGWAKHVWTARQQRRSA